MQLPFERTIPHHCCNINHNLYQRNRQKNVWLNIILFFACCFCVFFEKFSNIKKTKKRKLVKMKKNNLKKFLSETVLNLFFSTQNKKKMIYELCNNEEIYIYMLPDVLYSFALLNIFSVPLILLDFKYKYLLNFS